MNFVTNVYKKYIQHENVTVLKETMNEDQTNKENAIGKENKPILSDSSNKPPRRSVLECFDPLCSNSPAKIENPLNQKTENVDMFLNDKFSSKTAEGVCESEQNNKQVDYMVDSLELSQIAENYTNDQTIENEVDITLIAESPGTEDHVKENSLNESKNTSKSDGIQEIGENLKDAEDEIKNNEPNEIFEINVLNTTDGIQTNNIKENNKTDSGIQEIIEIENEKQNNQTNNLKEICQNGSNILNESKNTSKSDGIQEIGENMKDAADGTKNNEVFEINVLSTSHGIQTNNIKENNQTDSGIEGIIEIENEQNNQTDKLKEICPNDKDSNICNESMNTSKSDGIQEIGENKKDAADGTKNNEVFEINVLSTMHGIQTNKIKENNKTDSGIQEIIEIENKEQNNQTGKLNEICQNDKDSNICIQLNDNMAQELQLNISKENITEETSTTSENTITIQNKLIAAETVSTTAAEVEQETSDSKMYDKFGVNLENSNSENEGSADDVSENLNETVVVNDAINEPVLLLSQDSLNKSFPEANNECKLTSVTEETKDVLIRQEKDILNLQEKNAELSKTAEIAIEKYKNYENELKLLKEEFAKISIEKDNEIVSLKEEITKATTMSKCEQKVDFENKIEQLKNENNKLQEMINKYESKNSEDNVTEKTISREQQLCKELNETRAIMTQYEKAMEGMMRDHQQLKEEYKLTASHLATLETAFSDLNQRYERLKAVSLGYKENEEILLKNIKALEDSLIRHKNKYEHLKEHAKTQIERANKEILETRDQFQSEYNKLKAFVKRLEIKNASLESSLAQKTQECAALSELCDEVTRK